MLRRKTLKVLNLKICISIVLVLSFYVFYSYMFLETTKKKNVNNVSVISVDLPNVIVHIDLKGTPLKLTYLSSILPQLRDHGANGLLMEYEDMFPYEKRLVNLSAEYCYNKAELKEFLSLATKLGFQIIPLIQTFGHLEYALKLAEFQHMREEAVYPDSICPSKSQSKEFLWEIINQVYELHREVSPLQYIHIGCDEVFHMNKCPLCKKRNLKNMNIFLQHVNLVSGIVQSFSGDLTVLIWDDMLRNMKPIEWINIEPLTNVHPVYWDYGPDMKLNHRSLLDFHYKFSDMWIASAFKGADGRTATFPNITNRYLNHLNWMKTITGYAFGGESSVFEFKGIIITGWSRYSHMDPPCELLPVSYSSLILSLITVKKFITGILYDKEDGVRNKMLTINNHLTAEYGKSLNCLVTLDNFEDAKCEFEGKKLYRILKQYALINNEIALRLYKDDNSIVTLEYYALLKSINSKELLENRRLLSEDFDKIVQMENVIYKEMAKYYHKDFVVEYITSKSFSIKKVIKNLLNAFDSYGKIRSWHRRSNTNISLLVDDKEYDNNFLLSYYKKFKNVMNKCLKNFPL